MTMKLNSSAFAHNAMIPATYTCEGHDLSPPLEWSTPPNGTKSLVLIVEDPDAPDPAAPQRIWVHWLLYNLPPRACSLAQGVAEKDLPAGTLCGRNDWQRTAYGGPCPPIGCHRYFHKLYALDIRLPDLHHPTRAELQHEMKGHVIAEAELIGRYQKQH